MFTFKDLAITCELISHLRIGSTPNNGKPDSLNRNYFLVAGYREQIIFSLELHTNSVHFGGYKFLS